MQKTRVAIIGSGPAGYTAALYTARAGLEPWVFTGEKSGGQLMKTTVIENYPGFPEGKDGPQLMIDMRAQAEKFGAKMNDVFVTAVDFSARPFKLWTQLPENTSAEVLENGTTEQLADFFAKVKALSHDIEAESVVVAVGSQPKELGALGEKEFLGRGVSTCAVCDAAFYRGKKALVVGGGDTAMEDALALTKFAESVTILVRGDKLRASKVMQERLQQHPKVMFMFNTSIKQIRGESAVKEVLLSNSQTNTESVLPIDGVFIAIGHEPMTNIFANQLTLDTHGFIVTRQSLSAEGVNMAQAALSEEKKVMWPTMTSVEGVFAAGDVVDIRYWQAVTAAGQGCAAAIDAERWLEKR
jgi:thioredoxin reductase (NADPH)